jgi:serine/threonine-protein kinase
MCIATGGSSQVWECVEQASGRHLAMKLLKQDVPDFKDNKASLKHEADVLKTLEHPLIVKFEKFSSSRDNTYMVMEHFRAANVKLQLKSDIRSVHIRTRKLFESVCQALSTVHAKGWIHRDIKPDNVLMNKVGEIRLVDFSLASKEVKGFAKMVGGGKLKTIQGTRTYIAPETIRKQAPTFQTDIYSLGVMFFEVLTGRTPFQAPTPEELLNRHLRDEPANPSEFNKNVTPEMDRLVFRMLKKKPADRHASVDEVLAELKRIRIFKEDVTEITAAQREAEANSMDNLTDVRLDSRADAKIQSMLNANPELARQFSEEKQAKAAAKKAAAAKVTALAKETTDREAAKSAGKAGGPPAMPQPMPQQMMPQMMPQMPQPMMPMAPGGYMPPPGMPQPGFPQQFPPQPYGMPPGMPGAMPPGMGMPPGMPPNMVPPGMTPGMPTGMPPGMNPAGMPAFPVPGMPPQPAMPQPMIPGVAAGFPPQALTPPPSAPQPRPAQPPAQPAPQPRAAAPAAPAKPAAAVPAKPAAPAKPATPPVNPDEMEYMTELPDIL